MTVNAVLLLYLLSGIGFISYLFWRRSAVALASRVLFSLAVLAHLVFIYAMAGDMGSLPVMSPAQGANMAVFIASLVFIFFAFRPSTTVLGAFYLPVAGFVLGLVAPSITQQGASAMARSRIWYPLHTLTVISGEALFAVAFIASIVYLVHDSSIRKGTIHSAGMSLPPLKMLDRILSVTLSIGFVAITAGMIFGALWASSLGVGFSHLATKASAGVITWFVFAFSIHQRFAIGWKGRRTAIITIAGFALMAVLFIILNLVFPNAHGLGLMT
jgi:ABC-type transport system involved in cytochrome c biogenesis permease subunit